MKPCTLVAEVGATHLGQIDRAKELIRLAHICGADYVKFQKRNPEECVPKELWDKPHPNQSFAYGNTYLEHRKKLEFNLSQHKELQEYCKQIGTRYACSVFDITSANEILSLKTDYIKVPSCCNLNFELLRLLFDSDIPQIHISLGMLENEELFQLRDFLYTRNLLYNRVLLYHCTSEYPCPFERLYLKEIYKLKEIFGSMVRIGFSNHARGIAVDIASYILGVEWIERHFIDDRTIPHTDAAASLEPPGLHKLARDLKAVWSAMQNKDRMSAEEWEQRRKLRNGNSDD